ncbi:hypothetical protein C8Q78DRAFT_1073827 [Trametes maxima]|nr:hypothetical protein C8Q78DRAFT_1073827 [Trametes maxima]
MESDESADILGGRLQVSPPRPPIWSDPARITLLLGLATVAALAWVRIAPHYRQWRETRYRKAMRRRHGIPDDDHRPFNVAYAAALQARKRQEGKGRGQGGLQQPLPSASAENGSQLSPPTADVMPDPIPFHIVAATPSGYQNGMASVALGPGANSHSSRRDDDIALASASQYPDVVQEPIRLLTPIHGKHALDDELDTEQETLAKKSRIEEGIVNGGDEFEWHTEVEEMDVDGNSPQGKRGSKRVASQEDDEGIALSRADRRDKRARKVSIDKSTEAPDYEMEDDDLEDDLLAVIRGKKRDRAEAGSTFGGDDSILDDDEKPRRQQRRRTVSNKLGQASRGQKRVRDFESHGSDDSEVERPAREHMRKKRGKRSDEDDLPMSNDPLCKGRRIGEEWESSGVRFKVGPNGQRLRQELVKKSRSRFPMPSDSQHPDRRANVDVYVETWLTDEEYKDAKERHELAWQDAPTSPEPLPYTTPDSPSKVGKNLLWSSVMASRESPTIRGPLRQSISNTMGLRVSVFASSPVSSSRRISTVFQAPPSPATESPKLQKSKSYSKWEKQDLEAAAMSKIREKQLQQMKALPAPPPVTSTSAPSLFNTPTPIPAPAPTAAKASEKSSQPSFSFAPSTSAPVNKPPAGASHTSADQSKPSAPSFAFPTSTAAGPSVAPSVPAGSTSQTAPKPGPQSAGAVPNFFAKPTAPASTSMSTTGSTSVPNFFAKPSEPSAAPAVSPATAVPKPTFFAPSPASTQQPPSGAPTTNDASKAEGPKQVPGSSLLSRLGMGPPPPAQTSSTPMFSFANTSSTAPGTSAPATDSSKSTPFGQPANGSSTATPKFSFGAPPKPADSAPASTPTANGTFAAASAPASATAPASTTTPKFSFGVNGSQPAGSTPAASSPFQSTPSAASGTNAASAPKSAFSFGGSGQPAINAVSGSSAPAHNVFGGTSSSTNASSHNGQLFGAPTTPSVAAAKTSPFGAQPFKAPASAFGFGGTTPANAAAAGATQQRPNPAQNSNAPKTEAPKPTFSFGATSSAPAFGATSTPTFSTTTPSTAGTGSKPTFSFATGASNPAAPSAAPAASAVAGKTENKPTFSFAFGASNNASGNANPGNAAPSPSAFGFGAPSANASAAPAASSPFGSTPGGQQTSNAFGFGSTSSFSFGSSNSGQNAQK